MDELVEGIAPPLTRRKPGCQMLAVQHAENVYQQVPLPGVNCTDRSMPHKNEPILPDVGKPESKAE